MTVDERFAEFLRGVAADYNAPPETPRASMWAEIEHGLAAADYNAPPETPRVEMWERIEAAWTMRAAAPSAVREAGLDPLESPRAPAVATDPQDPKVEPIERIRRRPSRTVVAWASVAAALLIGVALGRVSVDGIGRGPDGPAVAAIDAVPPAAETTLPGTASTGTVALGIAGQDPRRDAPDATPIALPETPRLAAVNPSDDGSPVTATSRAGDASRRRSELIAVATTRHLGRTEALLTSFRSSGADDEDTVQWAGDLLVDTRLLLDRPVERDPRLTALLQELELVLMQIARLGEGAYESELEIVIDGIENSGMMPRLRSAIPAARMAIQNQGA